MEYKTAKRMECLPFSGIRAVMEKANKMQQAGEKIIHLEIGRPDFDTPEKIKKAANESLAAGHVFYTSNYGIPKLREAIAKWENENHGTDYEASEVLVTVGVGEATFASMDAFLDPGDEILVPNPVWLNYIHVPSALGAVPVTYSLKEENDYQIDFEEMESKITDKTKMIVVVNPSNPTGGVFSRETLEKLSEIAIRHDLLVIADEIYSQLVYDGTEHVSIASLPGMKERTITLNGFSKAYSMTGWRLGYAACNEEIVKTVNKLHQHVVTCATSFVQKAGVVALKEEKNEVTDMVKEYQRRRDYAVKAINEIDGLSCRCPKGAFYIFINIEKLGMTGQEFAPLLLENAKVALVPGDVFGTEGDHYVRMSFANSYENVVEGCKRLKEFVEKLRRNK